MDSFDGDRIGIADDGSSVLACSAIIYALYHSGQFIDAQLNPIRADSSATFDFLTQAHKAQPSTISGAKVEANDFAAAAESNWD